MNAQYHDIIIKQSYGELTIKKTKIKSKKIKNEYIFSALSNKSATTWIQLVAVDFVAGVYGARSTLSTFNKVDRVEFNFITSLYRACIEKLICYYVITFSSLSLLFHAGQAAIKLPSAEASKRAQCTSPGNNK